MGRGHSNHHVVLCKGGLRGEVGYVTRSRSEKLGEHQYREGYARTIESKREENIEYMWEQLKGAMVNSVREIYVCERWNNEVKAAVEREEAVWKEMLGASDEDAKERCMEAYKKERLKGVYIRAKRKFMNSLEGRWIKM